MNSKPHFKTRARLLNQLGEQLIKNEAVALLELVKNSYDADSPDCIVHFENPDNQETGFIIIEDHGEGMDKNTIENVWLEIGTSNKFDKKEKNYRTPVFHRRPLGEKGIGRFGAHRLGNVIEIITKKENGKECYLKIDWNSISDSKYIEDLPIELIEREEPEYFIDKIGTKIIISKLKTSWTRGSIRGIARAINSLNSPFEATNTFKTKFTTNYNWLTGILTFNDIKDKALYNFDITLSKKNIINFNYYFKPYAALTKVKERTLTVEDIQTLSKMQDDKKNDIDISLFKIGNIQIKGLVFDLDTKVLNIGINSGKEDIKNYLRENGGIQVFRDNMRIFDYGEPGNDWLELDAKRIDRPAYKLSNKLILAAVYLNGEESSDLVEKANREGFLDNQAYNCFKEACKFAIKRIELFRNQDKEKIRGMYFSEKKNEIPVQDAVLEIKEILERGSELDQKEKDELNEKLTNISNDFNRITDNLLKSAGAGLNLASVIHQIEKIVNNMISFTKYYEVHPELKDMIYTLSDLIKGYTALIRNSETKVQLIEKIINKTINIFSFRFKFHNIDIINNIKEESVNAFCSEHLLVNCLMNIFDNSIWWLNYCKRDDPKIFVDIQRNYDDFISVIIADNGPGFGILSHDELIAPYISAKPEGDGMGIGLHLTDEMMKTVGGYIKFPEPDSIEIPLEFKTGAIIELLFKKGK